MGVSTVICLTVRAVVHETDQIPNQLSYVLKINFKKMLFLVLAVLPTVKVSVSWSKRFVRI